MSATGEMIPPTARTSRRSETTSDVEVLARRALGVAMNALYDGGRAVALGVHDPTVVERACALLRGRVPDGPELALAVDLLERSAPGLPTTESC